MDPRSLAQVLCQLPQEVCSELIVGMNPADDAAVYKLNDDTLLIHTIDFFTPVVDDGYDWGQIAAANALSDVFAMGGKPIMALNIACFCNGMSSDVIGQVLKGGADKVSQAGAVTAGGHTVTGPEPMYGLAVVGICSPDQLVTSAGAKPGDIVVLTKPLGTGIIVSAMRGQAAPKSAIDEAVDTMKILNDTVAQAMTRARARGCTDITGFGLLGHAVELAEASNVSLRFDVDQIPVIDGVYDLAAMGIVPAGAHCNRGHFGDKVRASDIDPVMLDILYDPQTSGGLLITLSEQSLDAFREGFGDKAGEQYRVIGRVEERKREYILLQ